MTETRARAAASGSPMSVQPGLEAGCGGSSTWPTPAGSAPGSVPPRAMISRSSPSARRPPTRPVTYRRMPGAGDVKPRPSIPTRSAGTKLPDLHVQPAHGTPELRTHFADPVLDAAVDGGTAQD